MIAAAVHPGRTSPRSGANARAAAALLASLAGSVCSASAAASQSGQFLSDEIKPMLVLDDRLELRPVQVGGVTETSFHEVDTRGGRLPPRSLNGVLALLPRSFDRGAEGGAIEPAPAPKDRPWVRLVDGQRIVGAPATEDAPDDALSWSHDTLGPIVLRLDRIMRLALDPTTPAPPRTGTPAADDLIVLRNGDSLTGFVVAVQPQVEFESGGSTLTIPMERIARIDLVNEPVRPSGTHVWLTDGTRIAVHSLGSPQDDQPARDEGGRRGLTLHLEAPSESPLSETRSISLDELSAISFDAARITALSELPIEGYEPDPTRRRGGPPITDDGPADPLGAGNVLLPGPMSVEWALPDGAVRFAGWVTLPERALTWGDCTVVFEAIDGSGAASQSARARVRGSEPTVRINAPLPAGAERLRIRLEPGDFGAVQDRVLLERFILLTQP